MADTVLEIQMGVCQRAIKELQQTIVKLENELGIARKHDVDSYGDCVWEYVQKGAKRG